MRTSLSFALRDDVMAHQESKSRGHGEGQLRETARAGDGNADTSDSDETERKRRKTSRAEEKDATNFQDTALDMLRIQHLQIETLCAVVHDISGMLKRNMELQEQVSLKCLDRLK